MENFLIFAAFVENVSNKQHYNFLKFLRTFCLKMIIPEPGLTWHANHTIYHKLPYIKTAYGDAISFLFFFYGHGMESLSAMKLYGQLMTLMLTVWSSNVFHAFPLWNSMKFLFLDYGIIWNSCLLSIFNYILWLHIFSWASDVRFLDFMQSFRRIDFFSSVYQYFCFSFPDAQNFSEGYGF